jgi:glycosyltransferase involved in cell wall biosynthesis
METTMAPKVAYVLKMYPRFSETFILNEILELERQGTELHIFSLKKPDDGRFHADLARVRAGVTYLPEVPLLALRPLLAAHRAVYRRDRRRYGRHLLCVLRRGRWHGLKRFLQAGAVAARLDALGITHVHAHFASSATSVAYHVHQLTGIAYSFTAHAKDIYADPVSVGSLQRKLRQARFTVTVSDYNRAYLERLGAERLVRIYNGLDLEQFKPNGTLPAQPPLVLAVGRLVEKKGFEDLVRACAILRWRRVPFACQIVGKGEQQQRLRQLVQALDLGTQVHLVGPLPREGLLGLYPRAAVVAAPCVVAADGNRDGLPTVLIEAMALGVPVVATPVTGIPELVAHGHTGLLVPERDPEALAEAIAQVLADGARAAQLAQAGRARVEQAFDLRQNVSQLRELFVCGGVA